MPKLIAGFANLPYLNSHKSTSYPILITGYEASILHILNTKISTKPVVTLDLSGHA